MASRCFIRQIGNSACKSVRSRVISAENCVMLLMSIDQHIPDWADSAMSLQHSAGSRCLAHAISTMLESALRTHAIGTSPDDFLSGCLTIRMGVRGWMFLLVLAHPGSPKDKGPLNGYVYRCFFQFFKYYFCLLFSGCSFIQCSGTVLWTTIRAYK